ncbi:MAG: hypothetical protein C0505_18930 [Leptothrix sp. (in: Bacteria)]|nr:hypothetical protein [Leptothrix sp. (in: b-proteobacteria)]
MHSVLFVGEMIGAVCGIDPETGHHCDDTQRDTEASTPLSVAETARIDDGKTRRAYPRLDAALKQKGH